MDKKLLFFQQTTNCSQHLSRNSAIFHLMKNVMMDSELGIVQKRSDKKSPFIGVLFLFNYI